VDISNIPKTFWHSISIAILIATIGLTIISYKSASVSIEIANTKISLLSAIAETEKLNESLRMKNNKLKNEYNQMIDIIKSFEKNDSPQKKSDGLEFYNFPGLADLKKFASDQNSISDESFGKIKSKLNELRKSLE